MGVFTNLMGHLVVGVEDRENEEGVRVYIGARWKSQYVMALQAEGERLLGAWGSSRHLFTQLPADAEVFTDAPEEAHR